MKIKLRRTETFRKVIHKDPITIDTEDYPELEGLSEEKIRDYIYENGDDMSPPSEYDYEDSLNSTLDNLEDAWDKTIDFETDMEVEISD